MREQTQWMLLLHPTDVPHLSRLQPPFGSASSQAILLHLKAPGQPEGIPNECFSSWNRKRHWDTTLRYLSTLLGRTGGRAAALGGQMGQEVFSSSVRYTVSQHLEVLLERQGWINIIYLLFLWRRVSEPGYWYILRLYPVQSFLISSCSTWTKVLINSILITWRKVSLCKWKQGEVVSKKHLPRVGLVVAPVY